MLERFFEFGSWITRHRVWAHLLVLGFLNALLMGLYFSGYEALQQIVAPTVEGLPLYSWREFGLLETLQNLVLLAIVVTLLGSVKVTGVAWLRVCFILLAAGFLFVLLEEIDYGMHYLNYFGYGDLSLQPDDWSRNLHNRQTAEGVQYGSYMKSTATWTLGLWFGLAPFLLNAVRLEPVRLLLPSRWAAATVVLIVVLSRLAHLLNDSGLSHIHGTPGHLAHNISEFRELNMYCLFLLYFAELYQRVKTNGIQKVQRL